MSAIVPIWDCLCSCLAEAGEFCKELNQQPAYAAWHYPGGQTVCGQKIIFWCAKRCHIVVYPVYAGEHKISVPGSGAHHDGIGTSIVTRAVSYKEVSRLLPLLRSEAMEASFCHELPYMLPRLPVVWTALSQA